MIAVCLMKRTKIMTAEIWKVLIKVIIGKEFC